MSLTENEIARRSKVQININGEAYHVDMSITRKHNAVLQWMNNNLPKSVIKKQIDVKNLAQVRVSAEGLDQYMEFFSIAAINSLNIITGTTDVWYFLPLIKNYVCLHCSAVTDDILKHAVKCARAARDFNSSHYCAVCDLKCPENTSYGHYFDQNHASVIHAGLHIDKLGDFSVKDMRHTAVGLMRLPSFYIGLYQTLFNIAYMPNGMRHIMELHMRDDRCHVSSLLSTLDHDIQYNTETNVFVSSCPYCSTYYTREYMFHYSYIFLVYQNNLVYRSCGNCERDVLCYNDNGSKPDSFFMWCVIETGIKKKKKYHTCYQTKFSLNPDDGDDFDPYEEKKYDFFYALTNSIGNTVNSTDEPQFMPTDDLFDSFALYVMSFEGFNWRKTYDNKVGVTLKNTGNYQALRQSILVSLNARTLVATKKIKKAGKINNNKNLYSQVVPAPMTCEIAHEKSVSDLSSSKFQNSQDEQNNVVHVKNNIYMGWDSENMAERSRCVSAMENCETSPQMARQFIISLLMLFFRGTYTADETDTDARQRKQLPALIQNMKSHGWFLDDIDRVYRIDAHDLKTRRHIDVSDLLILQNSGPATFDDWIQKNGVW
jgi:hypothetical protein